MEKQLVKDVKKAAGAKKLKKNLADKNFKLDVSPDMLMVKDFYWSMQFEKLDITPKQAASQCGVKPSAVDEWFSLPEIQDWFMDAPIKMAPQLKATCMMAMRRGREIMMGDDAKADNMIKYFIDQTQGKAKEKAANALMDEDDNLAEDMERMEKMLSKIEELENEDDAEVQGGALDDVGSANGDGSDRDIQPNNGRTTHDGEG